ncbi:MAG: hypothetical protein CMN30_08440 [Sandaracinus sp.]|nr:hypothetical protein [Sandaracinus sp.]
MNLEALTSIRDAAWLYVAGPLLLLAALALTVRLRAPQFRRLGDAFRGLRAPGEGEGATAPGLATALAAAASFGAAGVVGAATAVSLAGPGALPWLWLFGILLAPVFYAQTLFAKTDAPGGGDPAASGSIPRRLLRMGGVWRVLGGLALVLALGVGILWGGAANAAALAATCGELLPGSTAALVGGAAGLGLLLTLNPKKTAGFLAWLALVGLAVLLVAALWAIATDPGAAFGALGSSFASAVEGAPQAGDFSGALAGEVAFAAVLHLLPATSAGVGSSAALEALSGGRVRRQAALSLLTPLVFAAFATLLVMAFVGTGAYGTRVEDSRTLLDARFYKVPAETASERLDQARLYDGYVRIRQGIARNPYLLVGSERGMIVDPHYEYNGRTADIALQADDGRAFRLMRNTGPEALGDVAASNLWRASVRGEMLPDGPTLTMASARTAGGDLLARILVAALLALAAVAFGGFGLATSRALPVRAALVPRTAAALLPGIGVGLVLTERLPGLPLLASIVLAAFTALVALVLVLRTGELLKLDAAPKKSPAGAPAPKKSEKTAD